MTYLWHASLYRILYLLLINISRYPKYPACSFSHFVSFWHTVAITAKHKELIETTRVNFLLLYHVVATGYSRAHVVASPRRHLPST
jgi:hypothetical protein